jgi:hypothetical protein
MHGHVAGKGYELIPEPAELNVISKLQHAVTSCHRAASYDSMASLPRLQWCRSVLILRLHSRWNRVGRIVTGSPAAAMRSRIDAGPFERTSVNNVAVASREHRG